MSRSYDIEPAQRFTAGAIGEPGKRTFFIQGDGYGERVTIVAEREQVGALGQALTTLLERLPDTPEEGAQPGEEELELREPLEAEWRAGTMALQYDEDADRIAILVSEAVPQDDEGEPEREPASARFVVTRAQARAVADHCADVMAAGRPRCQFCGNPLDPEGPHVCPTMNGHRKPAE